MAAPAEIRRSALDGGDPRGRAAADGGVADALDARGHGQRALAPAVVSMKSSGSVIYVTASLVKLLPVLGECATTYQATSFTGGASVAQRWTVGTQAVVRPPMVS